MFKLKFLFFNCSLVLRAFILPIIVCDDIGGWVAVFKIDIIGYITCRYAAKKQWNVTLNHGHKSGLPHTWVHIPVATTPLKYNT